MTIESMGVTPVGLLHTCIYIDHSLDPRPFLLRPTICCILVSHQELSLKFVRVGGHYHYNIIRLMQKKFGSWTHEATLLVKEVKSGAKHSGILGSETYNNTIMACKAGPKKHVGRG